MEGIETSAVQPESGEVYLTRLVSKEMNFGKPFVFDVPQGICFIPAMGKHIERNLSTNGVCEAVVGESFLKSFHKSCSKAVYLNGRLG